MRTHRRVHARIVAWPNIDAAAREACRGKRRRPATARFLLTREERLAELHAALCEERWRPSGYRTHVILDPKPRLISAAPFVDRVVHHAVHRVVEPILARRFVDASFACRPGRGTHRAVLAFQGGLRRFPWVGRLDVRRYFLEIDWAVLRALIAGPIRDDACVRLLDDIIRSGAGLYASPRVRGALGLPADHTAGFGKGLPIGNLTSQLFANLYLDGLDHFAMRTLKVGGYLRYMDDAVFFGRSRTEVNAWREAMADWLRDERRLEVHPGRAASTRGTFRFLGYVVTKEERRVARRGTRRLAGRLRARGAAVASEGQAEEVAERVRAEVRGWLL
ncbi:MAG: reverse transcriptase domain-containing protein [Deltaproteobacteria bacterium]